MKLKFTYLLFSLSLVGVVFLSLANSGGRAAAQNAGNTGAPGDANVTCGGCHATNSQVQISIDMNLKDENGDDVMTEYTPGSTYDLNVIINNEMGSPSVYGFQLLALKAPLDEAGDETSDYSEISANAQKSFASSTARSYLEHKGASISNEFSAKWTAPEIGSGPVSFYFCGNGADDSGNTQGDNIACSKIQFDEKKISNVNTISGVSTVRAFPNPTSDQMTLEITSNESVESQMTIMNLAGQQFQSRQINLVSGVNTITVDLNNFNNGIYFLQLATAKGMITRKIVKH